MSAGKAVRKGAAEGSSDEREGGDRVTGGREPARGSDGGSGALSAGSGGGSGGRSAESGGASGSRSAESGGRSAARERKLVLVVIDAMKPAMLERVMAAGRAPALSAIAREGVYVSDCVAAFPSVTPVCAATITTGAGPDRHGIPSMNWYHRQEGRYIEYGSSFSASRQFGVLRSLTDTVYRMNSEHLSAETPTVFEALDDAGVRTAGTTYLIYRGRHEHEVAGESTLARIVTSTLFRRTISGPRELFYADLYASRRTGCRGQLGLPGARDQHTGCVGAYLVEHDLFDFLLYSLPDNDAWSHRNGPHAQVTSLAAADRQLERLMHAAGGVREFLQTHAVIVCSDHSQAPVERSIRLDLAFEGFRVAAPGRSGAEAPQIALCPAQRAAMIYALEGDEQAEVLARARAVACGLEGVDLVAWREGEEGVVRSRRGELRFAPGGELSDLRGRRWSVEGRPAVLRAEIQEGTILCTEYPDALARLWSALRCPAAGELVLSAAPGWEFVDWGGSDHVGGGSHGSLHRSDSLGALLWCGTGPASGGHRRQWSLEDVAPMALEHFGLESPVPAD
ncbi:MAG TPA: alkaline phosphatase family protein [Solirubrobacteraceae bacterium]|nr:alkaline phosphatase family protein [Solirubrobacteraceae bacterium]